MLLAADSATLTGLITASAAVLTAVVTIGGSVLITRLNASATQRQREIDEAQKLQEYRRQLVEKRREERKDVYLRWTKAAQEVSAMVATYSHGPDADREKVLAAMKSVYFAPSTTA
jgi:hypothetical protein